MCKPAFPRDERPCTRSTTVLSSSRSGLPPTRIFFFAHSSCQEALNTLLIAARSGEGFLKVVGEVGTGKTLLCRKFLNQLETESFVTAFIPNPYLEPMTLLLAVADELGVAYPENPNQHLLLKALTEFLIATHADGKRVVLCLDEAQAMPTESLEGVAVADQPRNRIAQTAASGVVRAAGTGHPPR